jgi:hypothetical protein
LPGFEVEVLEVVVLLLVVVVVLLVVLELDPVK